MLTLAAAALALALALTADEPAAAPAPSTPAAPVSAPPVKPTADAPAAQGWKSVEVIGGLDRPWAICWLPDGVALITERPGRLRVARPDPTGKPGSLVLERAPVEGVPAVLNFGQGGLLDVAAHPRFATNRLIYLTHATGAERTNHTRLLRARLSTDASRLEDVRTLFDADDKRGGVHFGSRILFLPDGTFLLSIGDGGGTRARAQDLRAILGKTLRFADDGTTPPDNPFADRSDARREVYSFGHRNIQGMALDPESGRVWATEHGARGGDELNLIRPGVNYGWPLATFSREYHGPRISEHESLEGMENAPVVWTPCIAPSGLAFYTGDAFPQWKGDLFAGGLVGRQVRRVDLDAQGRVLGQETLDIERRVRDVRQGPDGLLYVLTDEPDGSLLRIEPR